MNLQILAHKTESGHWKFDHDHLNTVGEPLCNGTELVIDEYFEIDMKRKPIPGDQMHIIVDTEDVLMICKKEKEQEKERVKKEKIEKVKKSKTEKHTRK